MREFWILFRYEMKNQFPIQWKKGKTDIIGNLLSLLISLIMIVVCVVLISTIAKNYAAIKINKVYAPLARATELLNALYCLIILIMSLSCLERMRKTLTDAKDKMVFLRLPLKQETIFLSKLCVLLLHTYLLGLALILPVNIIIATAISPAGGYWLATVCVCLFLPLIPFLIACLLIVPYIKLIDFISHKYTLMFLSFTGLLVLAFLLYSKVLMVVEKLLETGSIQFLFNEDFISALQTLLRVTYPANSFASIVMQSNLLTSYIVVLAGAVVAAFVAYFVTKRLYYVTMYKNERRRVEKSRRATYKQASPLIALLKKEFICVFREPKHVFSYFAIAAAMPVMVYSCYSLFETLIYNTLGLRVHFSLALLIILIFGMLTNTFCSTNITRDGGSILKLKTFPLNAAKIFLAKVVFCGLVSSVSVILTTILLVAATSLQTADGLACCAIGLLFSFAQIFLATRMDMKHAKVSLSALEIEKQSSKTMSKVITIGFVLAMLSGVASVVLALLSIGMPIAGDTTLNVSIAYSYLVPTFIGAAYLAFSIWYYRKNISENFTNLVA